MSERGSTSAIAVMPDSQIAPVCRGAAATCHTVTRVTHSESVTGRACGADLCCERAFPVQTEALSAACDGMKPDMPQQVCGCMGQRVCVALMLTVGD